MEIVLLHGYLGFFACMVKNIIFAWRGGCEVRLNPLEVKLK